MNFVFFDLFVVLIVDTNGFNIAIGINVVNVVFPIAAILGIGVGFLSGLAVGVLFRLPCLGSYNVISKTSFFLSCYNSLFVVVYEGNNGVHYLSLIYLCC